MGEDDLFLPHRSLLLHLHRRGSTQETQLARHSSSAALLSDVVERVEFEI
jgi:hypothetical protein